MINEEKKKLLKIFKAQVAKEETEYFTVNAYTQLLYDSHKTALNLINRLQKENEEKDKQIDLMAEEINETDRGYTDYCEMKIECDRNCKDCIKRYYERKSEE